MGLIDESMHYMVALYRQEVQPDAFDTCLERLENKLGGDRTGALLTAFTE